MPWSNLSHHLAGDAADLYRCIMRAIEVDNKYLNFIQIRGVRPFTVTKAEAAVILGKGGVVLLRRFIYATNNNIHKKDGTPWLEFEEKGNPKKRMKIDTLSLEIAYGTLRSGEQPPLLPSQSGAKK